MKRLLALVLRGAADRLDPPICFPATAYTFDPATGTTTAGTSSYTATITTGGQ